MTHAHDVYTLILYLIIGVGIGCPLLFMIVLFILDRVRRKEVDRRYSPRRKSAYQRAECNLDMPLRPAVSRVAEVFKELGFQVDTVQPEAGIATAERPGGAWAPPAVVRAECIPIGPKTTQIRLSSTPTHTTTLFDYGAAVEDVGRTLEALSVESVTWN